MKEKWIRKVFKRRFYVALSIVLQLLLMFYIIISGSRLSVIVSYFFTALSFVVALFAATKKGCSEYKLIWVFMILLFPVLGGMTYLFFNFQRNTKRVTEKISQNTKKLRPHFRGDENIYNTARKRLPEYSTLMGLLQNRQGYPVYASGENEFFSPGEKMMPSLLEDLKNAKKFIFLEFFIVREGVMWNSVFEILKEKAQNGVDVRILYDDMGCLTRLPSDFPQMLSKHGIKCHIFNPFRPALTSTQNNRDHRKICAIDGEIAYTGGMNLSDEYINKSPSHDFYWKDCMMRICGDCARAYALIFLQLWEIYESDSFDFSVLSQCENGITDGFIQPFADCPADNDDVSEQVYLGIINGARQYLYIVTPYLIIGENILSALSTAAKSGVDVRIITPQHADKKAIHFTTRSYYANLIADGVKIYEHKDSFIHSKLLVADDKIASVGTANFDFRSLYLQFECGAVMYGTKAVIDVKEDIERTLSECVLITENDCKAGVFKKLFQHIMKLFAPLM